MNAPERVIMVAIWGLRAAGHLHHVVGLVQLRIKFARAKQTEMATIQNARELQLCAVVPVTVSVKTHFLCISSGLLGREKHSGAKAPKLGTSPTHRRYSTSFSSEIQHSVLGKHRGRRENEEAKDCVCKRTKQIIRIFGRSPLG